jgi:hypothetical protein
MIGVADLLGFAFPIFAGGTPSTPAITPGPWAFASIDEPDGWASATLDEPAGWAFATIDYDSE